MATIFSTFLRALHVPHTRTYSDSRFRTMPFQTLFGVKSLLREYGVATEGIDASTCKTNISDIPTPFIAPLNAGRWVVVTNVTPTHVSYISNDVDERAEIDTFEAAWSGIALVAKKSAHACEPSYAAHRIAELAVYLRNYGLIFLTLVLTAYLFILHWEWHRVTDIIIAGLDFTGLVLSWLLILKTAGIQNRAADRVCSVIQASGCHNVIKTGGTFLGIFHWSDVGFAYFSTSLAALALAPQTVPWLAIINICALPYTVWSVTYQHFKAHAWCTLCLGVQATLWLLFASYSAGQWWTHSNLSADLPSLFVIIGCYAIVFLTTNLFTSLATKAKQPNDENTNSTANTDPA